MAEQQRNWIWHLLRGWQRKDLDRLESELVRGLPPEKRAYAGDPNQAEHLKVRTRNQG
jgi:hypothetical protein